MELNKDLLKCLKESFVKLGLEYSIKNLDNSVKLILKSTDVEVDFTLLQDIYWNPFLKKYGVTHRTGTVYRSEGKSTYVWYVREVKKHEDDDINPVYVKHLN